jgi:hypothetical protein
MIWVGECTSAVSIYKRAFEADAICRLFVKRLSSCRTILLSRGLGAGPGYVKRNKIALTINCLS